MTEIAKNVYVTGSIITDLLEDPRKWLDGHDQFKVKYVGGLHNLSTNDKKAWAQRASGPLRIVETGTGREEVWFPSEWKSPLYISLDKDGTLTSHLKYNTPQPAVVQDVKQEKLDSPFSDPFLVKFSVWYQDDTIHRLGEPAISSAKAAIPVPDDEYIAGIAFDMFQEFWKDGEWTGTNIGEMTVVFKKAALNKLENQEQVADWIAKHCHGGFFPFSDTLFGDAEEEFLFLADICSKG